MYNGIGLQTARGSGTNGYVQRNLALIRNNKNKIDYRTEEELQKLEQQTIRGPNAEIREHARKRTLELKCLEMEDIMREQGYSEDEIGEKVSSYRVMLMEREHSAAAAGGGRKDLSLPRDQFGKPLVRETHAVAEAQQEKNARLKEAFGISEFFVEGSSLDPNRKAKEEAEAAAAAAAKAAAAAAAAAAAKATAAPAAKADREGRKYGWVRTPSPSPERSRDKKERKEKKKKKKRSRDRSSSEESRSKRHKSKKSKRSRSESPHKKKKRSRDKKKKKDESKRSRREEKHHRKRHRSSSTSSASTSSSASSSDSRRC